MQAAAVFLVAAGVVIALDRPDASNWTNLSLPLNAILSRYVFAAHGIPYGCEAELSVRGIVLLIL